MVVLTIFVTIMALWNSVLLWCKNSFLRMLFLTASHSSTIVYLLLDPCEEISPHWLSKQTIGFQFVWQAPFQWFLVSLHIIFIEPTLIARNNASEKSGRNSHVLSRLFTLYYDVPSEENLGLLRWVRLRCVWADLWDVEFTS